MARDVFVISDLHIGGEPGFQMLGREGQALLADFGSWLAERQRSGGAGVELVLAGDIVDFLAEQPWQAFTDDEEVALQKLDRIVERTRPIWDAWADLVASGGRLTFLLGNHDIELCFPRLVARIQSLLGDGQVRFVHDNQALVMDGGILIEHGNRYDDWNRVQHDDLRAIRSAFSRRERAGDIAVQPGSELVVRLMNDVKRQVDFIDLLKPEQGGLLPVLSALAPDKARAVLPIFRQYSRTWFSREDKSGRPKKPGYIAGELPKTDDSLLDGETLELAEEMLDGPDAGSIAGGGGGWLERWDKLSEKRRERKVQNVLKAVRKNSAHHRDAFDVSREGEEYLRSARETLARGFSVVIYGHTHKVRRVPVGGGRYLNSGTWADLVRFPEVVFGDDDGAAHAAMKSFIEDIIGGRTARWRFRDPTFVHIPGGVPERADVFRYDGNGAFSEIADGYRRPPEPAS